MVVESEGSASLLLLLTLNGSRPPSPGEEVLLLPPKLDGMLARIGSCNMCDEMVSEQRREGGIRYESKIGKRAEQLNESYLSTLVLTVGLVRERLVTRDE